MAIYSEEFKEKVRKLYEGNVEYPELVRTMEEEVVHYTIIQLLKMAQHSLVTHDQIRRAKTLEELKQAVDRSDECYEIFKECVKLYGDEDEKKNFLGKKE